MKKYLYILLAISFALLLPASTSAESLDPQPITLEAYLKLVRQHSPQLAKQRAELDVTRTELLEANLLPNPSIALQTVQRAAGQNTIDGREYEIMLEQPFLLFGQRAARKKLAQLNIEAAEFELEATALEITTEARLAFADLLLAQQKSLLFQDALTNIEKARQIIRTRVEEGAQSPYDLLRLDLEAAELTAEHHEILAEIRHAQTELTKFISQSHQTLPTPWIANETLELFESALIKNTKTDWQNIRKIHPTIRAAQRSHDAANSAIQRAQTERWPELNLGLGTMFTTDESSLNIIAAIGFDLPIFDRGQATIARAQAEAITTQRTLQLQETQLRTQFQQATQRLQAHQQALKTFRQYTQNNLSRLQEMAQESYAAGQTGILELLDALQTINTLQFTELQLLADLYKAHIELTTTGQTP